MAPRGKGASCLLRPVTAAEFRKLDETAHITQVLRFLIYPHTRMLSMNQKQGSEAVKMLH